MKKITIMILSILSAIVLFSCSNTLSPIAGDAETGNSHLSISSSAKNTTGEEEGTVSSFFVAINEKLEADGANYRASMADIYTDAASGQNGRIIYANDRAKKLDAHFVPGDPRRDGRTNITWAVDQVEAGTESGLTPAQTNTAITNAMATWDNVQCSTIPLTKVPDWGLDLGYVQFLLGFGGVQGYLADITQAGWLPGDFFDALEPGGSGYILGVTFTFIWVGADGPTDINNDGKIDVAFREIYYNDLFYWSTNGNIDVESVALHETGHGLSQDHFGAIFRTDANGKLHFAPLAVMNAAYTGVQQQLTGTDIGGHCSIWGNWPNN